MPAGELEITQIYATRGIAQLIGSGMDRVGRTAGGARGGAKSAAILGVAGFVALSGAVELGWTISWDGAILNWVGTGTYHEQDLVYYLSFAIPAAGVLAGAVCAALRRFRYAAFWALVVGGLLAADPLLKLVFHRIALSGLPGDYSFPSGSAMVSLGVVLALMLTTRGIVRAAAVVGGAVAVILYGGMIVLARWHYPSDVLAAWCAAIAWVASSWLLVAGPWRLVRFRDAPAPPSPPIGAAQRRPRPPAS